MTKAGKIEAVKTLIDLEEGEELNEGLICAYLDVAKNQILSRLYPFDPSQTEIPAQYEQTQCELAARKYFRKDGEGEISHNENGVNRTYGSVNDEDILARIVPFAAVVG